MHINFLFCIFLIRENNAFLGTQVIQKQSDVSSHIQSFLPFASVNYQCVTILRAAFKYLNTDGGGCHIVATSCIKARKSDQIPS